MIALVVIGTALAVGLLLVVDRWCERQWRKRQGLPPSEPWENGTW